MTSFSELPLSAPIARAITDLGYTVPSPIQAQTLPILLGAPTDFLGLAATGTGKTAAFAIPLLEKIVVTQKNVQGLILCPTRELALQVAGQIELLGKHLGISALPIYGGAPYGDQIRGLKNGAKIVVGTPGRVVDHINNGILKLDNLQTLILDEADEMISMGFKDDLETILKAAPKEKSNIWLFSATMSPGVRKVANDYLKNAQQVQVNRTEVVPTQIEQFYYFTRESHKPEILCKLIDAVEDFYGLIFCQTKAMVTDLTSYLIERGFQVDCLHGDMNQKARENTMAGFRARRIKVLICTDVASRGLDVKDITHVINYSLPRELENYVHRIGRTARSGKSGIAMSLVTPSHQRLISQIERLTKTRMLEGKIPTRKDVAVRKMNSFLTKFQEQKDTTKALGVMSDTWKKALEGLSVEDVAARFLTLEMPEIFAQEFEMPEAPKPREVIREEEVRRGRGPRMGAAGRDSFRSQLPQQRRSGGSDRDRNREEKPRWGNREDSPRRFEKRSDDRAEAPRKFDRRPEAGQAAPRSFENKRFEGARFETKSRGPRFAVPGDSRTLTEKRDERRAVPKPRFDRAKTV